MKKIHDDAVIKPYGDATVKPHGDATIKSHDDINKMHDDDMEKINDDDMEKINDDDIGKINDDDIGKINDDDIGKINGVETGHALSLRGKLPMGWEIKKLGEVCELSAGGDVPKDDFSEIKTENQQIPIYANGEKNEGFYGFTSKAKVTKPSITVSARGTIGYSVKRLEPFFPIVRLIVVTPNILKELSLDYLYYALRKIDFKHSGSSIPQLTVPMIKDYEIPLAPLPEQQRIVALLDKAFAAIAHAKANAEQNLKNAKELFESYLQGVFQNKGEDWEEKTLKEVCAKITDGTHQTPKYFTEGIIFLSSKNVTSGKIDWDNIKYIDERQHLEMHKRVAPRIGDILLAKNGTTGVAAMVDRDVIFDIYVSLAHIRVLEEVTPDFMLYFINSPIAKKQFNQRLKGSGVPNLHLEEIREVRISFPKSKKEQHNLVKKLNAFSTQTKKLEAIYQQKIKNLEELKKSILQKAFSGELKMETANLAMECV